MRWLKWTGIGLAGLLGAGLIAYLAVYVQSNRVLDHAYPVPAVALTIPTDTESIAEGKRLATIRGCFNSCHGNELEGALLFDVPIVARLVAPNLTEAARRYTPAELANIIRDGVRPDGRSLLVMPSEVFAGLTDTDLARIIAFLKSAPAAPGPAARRELGPAGRLGLVIGEFRLAADLIAATTPLAPAAGESGRRGRYLAATVCGECHGTNLRGTSNPEFTSPDLAIVGAYPPEAFAQLMKTGVALGGRTLGVMGRRARYNLSLLSDGEIADLYGYLHTMPSSGRPPAP